MHGSREAFWARGSMLLLPNSNFFKFHYNLPKICLGPQADLNNSTQITIGPPGKIFWICACISSKIIKKKCVFKTDNTDFGGIALHQIL